jgi:hypothetical protein
MPFQRLLKMDIIVKTSIRQVEFSPNMVLSAFVEKYGDVPGPTTA